MPQNVYSRNLRGGWVRSRRQRLISQLTPLDIQEVFHWRPQARQADFLAACGLLGYLTDGSRPEPAKAKLIGYGGAAGGGKTDGALGLVATAAFAYPGCRIGYFRRTYPELEGAEGAIARSKTLFGSIPGYSYNETKHCGTFPTGSQVFFRGCQYERDVAHFQSQQFDIIIFDEATHFTWPIVDYIITRNRATVPGLIPFSVMVTNPGNVGHYWYKSLFIDCGDPNQVHEVENPNGKLDRIIFLPARLEDNQILMERDPTYEANLLARDELTSRALRYGDWSVAAGLFFASSWRSFPRDGKPAHICEDFIPPSWWAWYGTVDYGHHAKTPLEKPFIYLLVAISPDGHCYLVDMLAAAGWDAAKQCEEILALESMYPGSVEYRVRCPSMQISQQAGSPTIAEEYANRGVPTIAPHTDRINGWERCRLWLRDHPDGKPLFMSMQKNRHFNQQIPSLPCNPMKPDEIDRNAEDHAAEAWRHFLMSRPEPHAKPEPIAPLFSSAGLLEKARRQLMQGRR